jgi:hypothetical protein
LGCDVVQAVIIDTFMWFREDDMAEFRLRLLDGLADRFIVGEADRTFQGADKPFRFPALLKGRLKPWADRIVHWPVHLPKHLKTWQAEAYQRESLRDAAATVATENDIVVLSDVDEVWGPEMPDLWGGDIRFARHDFRKMSVFWRWGGPWPGSVGGPWSKMRSESWQTLRDRRWDMPSAQSGWHFSWMGTADDLRIKANSFSHNEYADLPFEQMMDDGAWIDGSLTRTDEVPEGWLQMVPESWQRR